jgi:hypothetical protein
MHFPATGFFGKSRLYRNGVLMSEKTLANPINFSAANTKNLFFGKYGGNYWYSLNVKLDDIRIYNCALTDAEIQALANQ